jgi:hypothetical protein
MISRASPWRFTQSLALLFLAAAPAVRATTFEAPDLPRLVTAAEQIVRAEVLETTSYWTQSGGQPLIETAVRLRVAATEKGEAERELTLRMLGGRVGEERLQVDAMPELAEGDRLILFIQGNGRNVCPLVGWGHGAYRIYHDRARARDYLVRMNGEPLTELAQINQSLEHAPAAPEARVAAALSPAQFLAAVRTELERQARER